MPQFFSIMRAPNESFKHLLFSYINCGKWPAIEGINQITIEYPAELLLHLTSQYIFGNQSIKKREKLNQSVCNHAILHDATDNKYLPKFLDY